MQIPKSILLSFALQASFTDARGGRRGGGSSSKKNKLKKHPKAVCFEKGYEIEPDFEGVASPQSFYKECCIPNGYKALSGDPADLLADIALIQGCSTNKNLLDNESFQECVEDFLVSYPFGHAPGDPENSFFFEYGFAPVDDAPLGETAFRGAISNDPDDGSGNHVEKIILSYLSEQFDPSKFNGNLVGRKLATDPAEPASLEYIEYSFKAASCPGGATECPGKFYLNVYTKDPNDQSDPSFWYNCKFTFIPKTGADTSTGEWETFTVSAEDTVPDSVVCQGDANTCAAVCPPCGSGSCAANVDTMKNRGSNSNLELGNIYNQIFTLSMGTASSDDKDLEGYYDRIVVKIGHEENARVYDL